MDENAEVPVAPSRRSATFILDTMNAILRYSCALYIILNDERTILKDLKERQ